MAVLVRERRRLAVFVAVGMALGVTLALLRPATYTTTLSFVPQTSSGSRAGLASLAGQFGISLGAVDAESQPPQFYADLLATRGVLGPIALDTVPTAAGGTARMPVEAFLDI